MDEGRTEINRAELNDVLGALGVGADTIDDQLAVADGYREQVSEIAALAAESEAGVMLARSDDLDSALFELVDGLRQAGVALALGQTSAGSALLFGELPECAYQVVFSADSDLDGLVRAVAQLVPETHQILLALDYDAGDALPLVILDRESYARLCEATDISALASVLAQPEHELTTVTCNEIPLDRVLIPDLAQRFRGRVPDAGSSTLFDSAWARVRRYDPRVAWPDGQRRPPGDDFFELSALLAAEPLSRALANDDGAALANVLYRFALVSTLGAHWDVLAARQNPGMSAQGVLGLGQLTWSWFIFSALDAQPEAKRAAALLDDEWVRAEERGTVSSRQRAWFDLGAFLRGDARARAVGRLRELLPLVERAGWQNPAQIAAALAVHSEPRGDQLTHQPLYHAWPAPLYALARRAAALDLLPAGDAFLGRAFDMSNVDRQHELVRWVEQQLARVDAIDASRLPPLLDPLPVIVDVRITEVDARDAHGRTLLAARDDAEHHVVAPHGGRAMKPGEVWLLEVQGARQTRARARYDDLGEVSFQIALPTGEWLSLAEPRS